MAVYCVSYDLNSPGQDYDGLIKELQASLSWWHYLKSTWLIKTNESAQQLFNRLGQHIDKSDRILVIEVKRNYQGWLEKEAWDWINQFVPYSPYG